MPGLDNYDQWKTASPHDDQPDGDDLRHLNDNQLAILDHFEINPTDRGITQ